MPSITTPFNIFMEKKKPNKGGSGGDDDDHLAIVKSAAWAWYQHGSGSTEGKPMYEIDVTRTRDQAPRPSRYKLEAMRLGKEEHHHHQSMEGDSSQTTSSPIRTDTSLLDDYEIESISKQLDDLIASSSKRFYGLKIFDKDHILRRSMSFRSDDPDQSTTSPIMKKKKREKKKKSFGGFWGSNSVVCGTREDVDTRAVVRMRGSGGSRKSMSW